MNRANTLPGILPIDASAWGTTWQLQFALYKFENHHFLSVLTPIQHSTPSHLLSKSITRMISILMGNASNSPSTNIISVIPKHFWVLWSSVRAKWMHLVTSWIQIVTITMKAKFLPVLQYFGKLHHTCESCQNTPRSICKSIDAIFGEWYFSEW